MGGRGKRWIVGGAGLAGLALFTVLANGPRGDLLVSDVDWSAVRDDANRTLELSWMPAPYYPTAREGEWVERMVERRFNVEITPYFLSGSDYNTKKPMMFSGGLVPDVTWESSPINVQQDARNGFIVPVPYELLLKHAPDYVRAINTVAPEAWMYSYYKERGMARGVNMGVPTTWTGGLYPPVGYWRLDWLKKVGITRVPRTLDEMHEALLRFHRQDLGGGGAGGSMGTHPMTANVKQWWQFFSEIFNAYGVLPFNWVMRDGKVVWGGTLPEAREALVLLRQWYAEGIIHPDFVSDDADEIRQKFFNGKLGYVNATWGWGDITLDPRGSLYRDLRRICPRAELALSRFPVGPGGHSGFHIFGGAGNIMVFGRGCREHPEKILRVLRMWNEVARDEAFNCESRRGRRGEQWEYRRPLLDPNGQPVLIPGTDRPRMDPNSGIEYIGPWADPLYRRAALTLGSFAPVDLSVPWADRYEPREVIQIRNAYCHPRWGRKDVFMKPDVVPAAGRYILHLRELQKEYFCDIIRGVRPMEDFDRFVQLWRDQGGAEMTRQANELHEDMKWVYRQVGATWRD